MQQHFSGSGQKAFLSLNQQPDLGLIHADSSLIAVNKPAGQLFHGYTRGTPSPLADQVKDFIREEKAKDSASNVYLGIVHRLDRPVSGIALFARSSKITARLALQFQERSVEKLYLAVVDGLLPEDKGELKDELPRLPTTDGRIREGGVACHLFYSCLAQSEGQSLLAIRLGSGRRHQIRMQLAKRSCTIRGDREYGSLHEVLPDLDGRFAPIALHAAALRIAHPKTDEALSLVAELPFYWLELPFAREAQAFMQTI